LTHEDRAQFAEALRIALEAHGDQKRRGTRIPYVSHLLQVAGLVLEHGGDVEQAIAGLLHDIADDGDADLGSAIGECFGPEVQRIVRGCTGVAESGPRGSDSSRTRGSDSSRTRGSDSSGKRRAPAGWRTDKQRYLDHLRQADDRVKLVTGCDKLDNLRSLVADLHAEGAETLSRFHATPTQLGWYYGELRQALGNELPHRLLREIDALTRELAGFIAKPRKAPRAEPGVSPAPPVATEG
jgi:(p)ppGpp synthase/HD superfamily hydrolase